MGNVLLKAALAAAFMLTATAAEAQDLPKQSFKVVGSFGNLTNWIKVEQPFWAKDVPEASKGQITAQAQSQTELGLKGNEIMRLLKLGLFDFARSWWGSIAPMRKGLRIEGEQHLDAARAGGRGVILVSGHFTTLEICGRLLCDRVPLAGMYRPHAQGALQWAGKGGRLRYAAANRFNARHECCGDGGHAAQQNAQLA